MINKEKLYSKKRLLVAVTVVVIVVTLAVTAMMIVMTRIAVMKLKKLSRNITKNDRRCTIKSAYNLESTLITNKKAVKAIKA